jgi:hypothetical protein
MNWSPWFPQVTFEKHRQNLFPITFCRGVSDYISLLIRMSGSAMKDLKQHGTVIILDP